MMKFTQVMRYGVGGKYVSFAGREPFRIADKEFANALLATGCFARLKDGTLRYSGRVTIITRDGREVHINAAGYINVEPKDFDTGKMPDLL